MISLYRDFVLDVYWIKSIFTGHLLKNFVKSNIVLNFPHGLASTELFHLRPIKFMSMIRAADKNGRSKK